MNVASISDISESVAILKIFYLNLERSTVVGYQFSYYVIRFWEIRRFLTNRLRESHVYEPRGSERVNTDNCLTFIS
jgi:hypothetical protein